YGGVRPFGTALLVAGVEDLGTHLFETDPTGALVSYNGGSTGQGRQAVMELLEEKYKDNMAQDDAMSLGLQGLQKASEPEKLEGVQREDDGFLRDDGAAGGREADCPARRDSADDGTTPADVGGEAKADRAVHRRERDQPADRRAPSATADRERDGRGESPRRSVQERRGTGQRDPRCAPAAHPDSLREGPDCGEAERRGQREGVRRPQVVRN